MPELPEVETVRRGLAPVMEGARFLDVEAKRRDLRRPLPRDFARRLTGKTVKALGRRAKYLLAYLSSNEVLLMHLGMSGSFRISVEDRERQSGHLHHRRSGSKPHDHVTFHMSSGALVIFNDPRRFGLMLLVPRTEIEKHPLIKQVGPEPLEHAFSAAILAKACANKKLSLKAALSDQKVVAGLGNIYVCEALHRARLSPKRKASTIAGRSGAPSALAASLVEAIKSVLEEAIRAGGSSLRDHRRTNGALGDFQHCFRVYDREGKPCPTPGCPGRIRRIIQSARSTFFCPVCQK
jgi:formamidopyrimidine-DNA glycosylase